MALPNLTLRSLSPTVGTNKGSALTFAEMDTNLNNIATANITLTAGGVSSNLGFNNTLTIHAGNGTEVVNTSGNVSISATYSNVQVATYLPTYSGNIANVRLGISGVLTFTDGTTQTTAASGGGGNGNVSSTGGSYVDNALIRYDGTSGNSIAVSLVTVSDTGAITAPSVGSVIPFYFANQAAFPSAATYHGALAHSHSDGKVYFAHSSVWNALANESDNFSNVQVTSYLAGNVTVGNIAGKTNGFTLGYLEMPQVASANVTLALTDSGKHFYDTSTAPITVTIPNNANVAFGNGTVVSFVNNSTGNLIIGRQDAVSLYLGGNATSAGRTITSYGVATLMKVATNTWFVNGSGVV